MASLAKSLGPVKGGPLLPPPPWCPECKGAGWLGYTVEGDSVECPRCLGWGEVKEPEPVVPTLYVAEVAGELLDTGLDLKSFVRQLLVDWPATETDIACWAQEPGDGATVRSRLLAVLHPGPRGKTEVRWLA